MEELTLTSVRCYMTISAHTLSVQFDKVVVIEIHGKTDAEGKWQATEPPQRRAVREQLMVEDVKGLDRSVLLASSMIFFL